MKIERMIGKIYLYFASESMRVNFFRKKGVKIGENCSIEKNIYFGTEPYLIEIGNNVRLTSGVKFITHDGGMWVLRNLGWLSNADKFGTITIGNNVNVGWNTIFMPNVNVGDNVVIGAGAIVTKDVPSNMVYAGIPAKKICSIEEYCEKNKGKIDYTKSMTAREKRNYLEKKIRKSTFYENQ